MTTIDAGDRNKTARMAGFLYLIVVAAGIFSLAYVPSQILVPGDAAATVSNIVASEPLFRLWIVVALICYTAFLVLPFVLYRLLSPVGTDEAALMVAFAVVSVPIAFVNELNKFEILSLVSGADYLQAFSAEQLRAEVMLTLASYNKGLLVLEIFWGLWLLPFGYLVFKSAFLPTILGVLLMLGCLGYLIDFSASALFAGYSQTAVSSFVTLPARFGEIGICLWLLIMGVRKSNHPVVALDGPA